MKRSVCAVSLSVLAMAMGTPVLAQVQTPPVQTRPTQTRPVQTPPVQARPAQTQPVQTPPVSRGGNRGSTLAGTPPVGTPAVGTTGRPSQPTQVTSADPESRPIATGQTQRGQLAPGDAQLDSGEFYDVWNFQGQRGQIVDLRMQSSDFDPYVAIVGPNEFSDFNDDDPDGGTNSRLIVTLPSDGAYTIAATSYAGGESGSYSLTLGDGRGQAVRQVPVAPAEQAQSGGLIQIGQTVAGALQPGDGTLQSGEYSDDYRFVGRRGQRIRVELTSSAFDAYTILRTPSGDQTDVDDSEGSTDSVLDMVLPEDGEYQVSVTSYQPGETGSYRFSVSTGAEPPRQAAVQGGARIFAVMVGVSDYGGTANNLDNTDQDALQLAEQLQRDGSLNGASVTLINSEATVAGVRGAFQRVAAEAGPDDTFLFFFSGHGGQNETSVSGLEPDGVSETIVMRDGQISDEELGDLFGTLRTRLSLLILDSCFSGGFARNVVDRPGVMGLFSSEEDLTSAVADKFRAGGYLSHFVREGMSGAADADGDHLVTAGELSTYLRRQFRIEVEDVESVTGDGQRNYQNLVIDRGGVQVDDVIVRLPGSGNGAP